MLGSSCVAGNMYITTGQMKLLHMLTFYRITKTKIYHELQQRILMWWCNVYNYQFCVLVTMEAVVDGIYILLLNHNSLWTFCFGFYNWAVTLFKAIMCACMCVHEQACVLPACTFGHAFLTLFHLPSCAIRIWCQLGKQLIRSAVKSVGAGVYWESKRLVYWYLLSYA